VHASLGPVLVTLGLETAGPIVTVVVSLEIGAPSTGSVTTAVFGIVV